MFYPYNKGESVSIKNGFAFNLFDNLTCSTFFFEFIL